MIEYRSIKQHDLPEAIQYCLDNGVQLPNPLEIAFGAWEDDKLVGICALKKTYQIEPLVNTSKYGGVAQILAEKVMACATLITKEVIGLVKSPETVHLFEKYGFVVRDANIALIEKEL